MNGLEALEKIHNNFGLADNFSGDFLRKDIQEEMLEPIEKELKALEIIKKKVDERRIVLENDFDNKFSLGGLELYDLTYRELATILECFDFENIKVVNGKIQLSLTNRELEK